MEPLEDRNLLSVAAAPVAPSASAGYADVASASSGNTVSSNTTDSVSPTVTINYTGDQTKPTTASPINFSVVFSEPVIDFTADAVTLGGTAAGTLVAAVTGSGTTYNVAISGMTGDGTVIASIAAGVAHDSAGNANLASTSQYNIATYWVPPVISNVVVAEVGSSNNNALDNTDTLKITWAASSQYGAIAGQILTIDGNPFSAISGPFAGQYYSCQIGTLAAGHHVYTIQTADSRTSNTFSGSFDVAASGLAPVISNVVVAEATAPRDGVFDSSEKLVVSWEATGPNRIASQSLEVDGSLVTPIYGPYSGLYYSSLIGTRGVGDHSYKITSIDLMGASSTSSGTFTVVAAPGPAISSVVIAEAAAPRDGTFDTTEKLVITWAATSPLHIVSQTLTVDGSAVAPIKGPYSRLYYSCQIGTWTAGSHTYAITATDSQGGVSTSQGSFMVVQPVVVPPTIADVVVAEASATKNGDLESNDVLKMTWAASSPNRIASQTLQVDGSQVAAIKGPFGGLFYSCQIGKCDVGSHSYKITATDAQGVSSISTGTFTVVAPAPPTIADVVVARTDATQTGAFAPTDSLKITWSATSQTGLASQTLTIDGAKISPINGVYGGRYYSCQIGTWPAGTYTYTITATDSLGGVSTSTGTIVIVAPASSSLAHNAGVSTQRAGALAAVMNENAGLLGDSDTSADDLLHAMYPVAVS
jgi:hypothetical protein